VVLARATQRRTRPWRTRLAGHACIEHKDVVTERKESWRVA
jgi:hypothetical protein